MRSTVLIIPPNDAEAVMIFQLAKAIGLPVIESMQPHGATLDREPKIAERVKNGRWERVVVVEMPGPKTEAKIQALGTELVIIDHHHYTNLDRAHDPKTHKLLPSSLEQFLKLFRISEAKLCTLGFSPKLVRGIGIMDRGFVWALAEEGYVKAEIRAVIAYQKKLMGPRLNAAVEARKDAQARKAWDARGTWGQYQLIIDNTKSELRPRISLIIAVEVGRPIPLILVEKKRGLIYVQESPHAMKLFKKFGGFTFGLDRNWGYKNEKGKPRIGLKDVQAFLSSI